MTDKLTKIIKGLTKAKLSSRPDLVKLKKQLSNQLKMNAPLNSDLLKIYKNLVARKIIKPDLKLERLLRKRELHSIFQWKEQNKFAVFIFRECSYFATTVGF